ncbi:SMP-30/gluconolactonase/LRE family protein [Pricia sp. S334]|uniref:SMP-30/gluconolactonase/LRE family protein n=1 Tax=Pricia mediterranea TaxID=3076079 RepID=A0ABU3L9X2_9FLAO|nr:SMP-30/gluconolactonase/LRE family protein [Pricia sp. S334]MDT7830101.1 SMP-30/gluconolactonase/LRE family protein [Pricia sp. S334]
MNIRTIGNPITIMALLLIFGCKDKSEQNKETSTETPIEKQDSMQLYRSEIFTEPGGFPSGIEGPAVAADGTLYAVNFEKPGTIGRVTPGGKVDLFVTLPDGSTGNGIRFDQSGDMLIADYTGHNILTVDMDTKEIDVFAHNNKMNQPNDIAISDSDILFASDPDWEHSTGQIWRIDTDGSFTLLEADMGTTNGIEVSPDNKTLYVNESVQRNVWAYDLSPEGNIDNKRLLIKFDDFGMDGMRCDVKGNLYITRHGKGTVVKVSPDGDVLEEIFLTGKQASNIAFGGEDGTLAYVTLQDTGNIDRFRVEHPGRAFALKNKK